VALLGHARKSTRIDTPRSNQQEGRIESFEVVLLEPHGGDLAGFILLRGSAEQIASLQADEEFRRLATRAGMIVQSFGMVRAFLGDGLGRQIAMYEEAIGEFA
jgi:hypothetical protein